MNLEQGGIMEGGAAHERTAIPLACDPSALTDEQWEHHRELYGRLRADVKEVRELEDGYAFRHSADSSVLLAITEFVGNERLCCPFFEFEISVGRGGGPVWLRISGEGEAKRVLEAEMGA
jgi:hypothetical protein